MPSLNWSTKLENPVAPSPRNQRNWPIKDRDILYPILTEKQTNIRSRLDWSWVSVFFSIRKLSTITSQSSDLFEARRFEYTAEGYRVWLYELDTSYVLQDIDDEHKEAILAHRSERVAIDFGLIDTEKGLWRLSCFYHIDCKDWNKSS